MSVLCPFCGQEATLYNDNEKNLVIDEKKVYQCLRHRHTFVDNWPEEVLDPSCIKPDECKPIRHLIPSSLSDLDIKNIPGKEIKKVAVNVDWDGNLSFRAEDSSSFKPKDSVDIAYIYTHSNSGKAPDWWIVDLERCDGIFLNGERMSCHNQQLFWGDTISFGDWTTENHVSVFYSIKGFEEATNVKSKGTSHKDCISVKGISWSKILNDVSFSVQPGEFIGILGLSGCGKSSLIQCLVGLITPDGGSIDIYEQPLTECQQDFLAQCAYVPQQTALNESLTVEVECKCFAKLHPSDIDSDNIDGNIDKFLHLVGLEEEKAKEIHLLSGGQKKRLGIALELLRKPQILFLDEPTAGLDPASEKNIMEYLRRTANQGKTVVCATHVMDNVACFDKILVLSKSGTTIGATKVFFGTPDEAKEFFKVSSYQDIFNCLVEDSDDEVPNLIDYHKEFKKWKSTQSSEKSEKDAVENKWNYPQSLDTVSSISRRQQFWAYCKRSCSQIMSSWSVLGIIFLQPILIALVIHLACSGKYFSCGDLAHTYFFCLVSIFWLGMNNSVRELVSERIPYRCLERLKQIPVSVYLWSKWCRSITLCFLQTLSFYSAFTFLGLTRLCPYCSLGNNDVLSTIGWVNSWWIFVILFCTCLVGSFIGLMVSAGATKQTTAVAMLPLIIIPILLWSYPVIQNSDKHLPIDFHHFALVVVLTYEFVNICGTIWHGKILQHCNGKNKIIRYILICAFVFFILYLAGLFADGQFFDGSVKCTQNITTKDENPYDPTKYSQVAVQLEHLSPCHMPYRLIDSMIKYSSVESSQELSEKKDTPQKIGLYWFLSLFLYLWVAARLTYIFQDAREREWEGR